MQHFDHSDPPRGVKARKGKAIVAGQQEWQNDLISSCVVARVTS